MSSGITVPVLSIVNVDIWNVCRRPVKLEREFSKQHRLTSTVRYFIWDKHLLLSLFLKVTKLALEIIKPHCTWRPIFRISRPQIKTRQAQTRFFVFATVIPLEWIPMGEFLYFQAIHRHDWHAGGLPVKFSQRGESSSKFCQPNNYHLKKKIWIKVITACFQREHFFIHMLFSLGNNCCLFTSFLSPCCKNRKKRKWRNDCVISHCCTFFNNLNVVKMWPLLLWDFTFH